MSVQAAVPEVRMAGTGTVEPPAVPMVASYTKHYEEFRRRGLSHAEADRIAREVVERDTHNPRKE